MRSPEAELLIYPTNTPPFGVGYGFLTGREAKLDLYLVNLDFVMIEVLRLKRGNQYLREGQQRLENWHLGF